MDEVKEAVFMTPASWLTLKHDRRPNNQHGEPAWRGITQYVCSYHPCTRGYLVLPENVDVYPPVGW